MAFGYWNKILRVDLTKGRITAEEIDDNTYKLFLGGSGIGAKILWEEVPPEVKPFDADNRIIFAVGPFQGHPVVGNAKISVISKSPLTNTYADSTGGGSWGVFLKKAGYDALVIKGKSEDPVYIYINDGQVRIIDAQNVWGKDSYQSVDLIKKAIKEPRISIATIGQAGENLVKFACIVVDKWGFAGRCGLGAVMGSKKLKAVVVRGTKEVPVSNLPKLRNSYRKYFREVYQAGIDNEFGKYGTTGAIVETESHGDAPIKYWNGDVWSEGAKKIAAPNYTKTLSAKPHPCLYCPLGCHQNIRFKEPGKYELSGAGPQYETMGMFGSNLLIDDLIAICEANDLCNKLGMDTISAGACVGLAMECYEKGLITKRDTNGMEIEWGDPEVLVELIKQIGNRQGFGSIFSDGTLEAAQQIGDKAVELVVHVKGLDFPAHDARACWSLAPSYATGTRGACHMRGPSMDFEMGEQVIPEIGVTAELLDFFNPKGKALLAMKIQDFACLVNSLVLCFFVRNLGELKFPAVLDLLNLITGWNWDIQEAMLCSERIFTLQRLINLRDGYTRKDDVLPRKMLVPAKEGFRAGQIPPFNDLLNEYYQLRKWDENGQPTNEKLQELGLADLKR